MNKRLFSRAWFTLFSQVPTFKGLPEETLIKIADVLEEYTYKEGQCIIRQVIDLKSVKFLTNLDNLDF